jgi:hypothetical protein
MATIVITIRLDGAGPGITLNDGVSNGPDIRTFVNNGDIIKWKLIPNSGITSLDDINDTGADIFNPNPTPQRDGSLQGTISAAPGALETYLVVYTLNGVKYNHDPSIQVHQ